MTRPLVEDVQLELAIAPLWLRVTKWDARAASLADRHYSRQTVGASQVLPPGKTLLLLTADARAVWGVVLNMDPTGRVRWRNSIFRNESRARSSALIRAATSTTYALWHARYGALPEVSLTTEVDIEATRARRGRRRPPGYCYLKAGWRKVRDIPAGHGRSAKVELMAPDPA